MAFIQDPRLRQRWNRISHNAETVTENAAAGIWSFQQNYLNPCLASALDGLDSCTGLCIGDREERARRAREREWGARPARPEYMFDFYDDWDDLADDEAAAPRTGGLLGSWGSSRNEDWDRLVAGPGAGRARHAGAGPGDVVDQPRRKRGMSYGTRGARRKGSEAEDPTIIPSTAPLGFLGRLPFKIGGTLRYKPSAANLRDHPGASPHANGAEFAPLLGGSDDEDAHPADMPPQPRPRSNTAGSGETSSSYRSRGDLFPSDGEGEEDAVPLDDEFDVALERGDDRSSNKTRSSKGKRPAGRAMSRTVSRTTISSTHTRDSRVLSGSQIILPAPDDLARPSSMEDLEREEAQAEREEHERNERQRKAAAQLALERGLSREGLVTGTVAETKADLVHVDEIPTPSVPEYDSVVGIDMKARVEEPKALPPIVDSKLSNGIAPSQRQEFVPARLPHFG
ncbi:hypothetical protein GQ53DRAFT_753336 [Thozetella sp. PMI_491]|nr:hypothetical protein GQ53DRAFT_753336 [Thozetella sp. PMI_491]